MLATHWSLGFGARSFWKVLPVLAVLAFLSPLHAQSVNSFVEEGVQIRIEQQELAYLNRTGQISPQEYQQRVRAWQQRNTDFNQRFARLSRDEQPAVRQQLDNRYAVVFPPLQQEWNAETQRLRDEAAALNAKRAKELEADARTAGQLQTERVFRQRRIAENTLSPAQAAPQDDADTAKISALQNKYVSYGGNWAARFNQNVQQFTDKFVQERDLSERLADTTSAVGQDARRAVQLSLAMAQNDVRRSQGVINYHQEELQNAPFKSELDTIQSKYAVGGPLAASARDFNERVNTLVLKATRENRDQWAKEARTEYAAIQVTASPPPALVQTPAPTAQPVDTGYLSEMPQPDRVVADVQGSDTADTLARQWGALYQLREIITVMSDGRNYRNQLTSEEGQLQGAYMAAMQRLEQPKFDDAETRRLGMNSPRAKWFDLRTHYELDKSLRAELLKRYLSAAWQTRFLSIVNAQEARRLAQQQQVKQQQQLAAQRPTPAPSPPTVNVSRSEQDADSSGAVWVVTIGLLIVVLLIVWRFLRPVVRSYNSLVTLRNQTQNAWAQIDVQLKRRHDLILNFVEVVKGYTKHERGTLEQVTQARATAVGATTVTGRAQAEDALSATVRTLFSVVEAYPDLKANQSFRALEEGLTSTENALAGCRHTYNNVVLAYNTRIQSFPTNILAKLFRFALRDYFELKSEGEREVPQATF